MEREIIFLSADELDAVVGGRMNDGKQQLINKDQRGVPGTAPHYSAADPNFGGIVDCVCIGVGAAIAAGGF
ncbi:hypothetical protein [Bradyrhizobium sp.]|jgi:hypothetical protein|uniref:hypothetical protein n=1 Tax=Bradyrhizobium sp. TaxID=376 RepID=UPI003BB1C56E